MMTTVSALFGALPLVLASGAGVELRRPLGLTIVGGLILSQILTLYTTPVVYLYLDRFRLWANRKLGIMKHGSSTIDNRKIDSQTGFCERDIAAWPMCPGAGICPAQNPSRPT